MTGKGEDWTSPCYYCTANQDNGCCEDCPAYERYLEQQYIEKSEDGGKNNGNSKA